MPSQAVQTQQAAKPVLGVSPKPTIPVRTAAAMVEQPRRRPTEITPPPVATPRKVKSPKPKKHWVKRIFKILGLLLLIAIVGFGVRFFNDIAKLTGNRNPFAVLTAFQKAQLKNENGRVNILVAGNSADDAGHNGGELTDSIMVLSLDTNKKTAMMLSIPRDMWVTIPGHGHAKINAAYTYGGMDTLASIVENDLDVPIHYKALVNYSAFRDLVNAVGGITITVDSTDKRGIYDPNIDYTSRNCCALAKYPNGPVTLNGKQALNLARARGDPNAYGIPYGYDKGDFTRTEYQRKMLVAIGQKASSASVLTNPVKISNLLSAVGNNVTTDLNLNEIQTLASYGKDIDLAKIDSYNINYLKGENTTMLANYTSPDGQSTLIPAAGVDNYTAIAEQIKKIMTATPVQKEAANVVVLNAADTAGLAKQEGAKLETEGMVVVAYSDTKVQDTVTIIDKSSGKKSATIASLKKRYNAKVVTDAVLSAGYPNADIIVVLGKSAAVAPSTTTTK